MLQFLWVGILELDQLDAFGLGSSWAYSPGVIWGYSHLRAQLGLNIYFQDGHVTWLLAGSLSSLLHGPLYRAIWKSLQHGNWSPPEPVIWESEPERGHNALYDWNSVSI